MCAAFLGVWVCVRACVGVFDCAAIVHDCNVNVHWQLHCVSSRVAGRGGGAYITLYGIRSSDYGRGGTDWANPGKCRKLCQVETVNG